jgi:hypothetical protein
MIAPIADVIEQAAEVATQLADRDSLRHWLSVHDRVHSFSSLGRLAEVSQQPLAFTPARAKSVCDRDDDVLNAN